MKRSMLFNIVLGRVLRHLRKSQNIEQWQIAEVIYQSQSGVSRIENGSRPHIDSIWLYCRHIDQELDKCIRSTLRVMSIVRKELKNNPANKTKPLVINMVDALLKKGDGILEIEDTEEIEDTK